MHNKQQILISIAIFIATMFGGAVNAQNPLYQVNREIARTRHSIDSVRDAHAVMMTRQLEKNVNYRYISANQATVNKLPDENEQLMTRAIGLIRKQHPTVFVPRTSVMFIQYGNIPGMSIIRDAYNTNTRRIQEYKRRVLEFQPEYQMIKNRCDSIRNAQVEMYQLRLDSLLNIKLELTR
ncbi:MAG: hypothetical protein K2M34_03510 [Alphaproteobacteria bacterium]|nr:hypothetical protein [Alphaproteobacteria bacterium]